MEWHCSVPTNAKPRAPHVRRKRIGRWQPAVDAVGGMPTTIRPACDETRVHGPIECPNPCVSGLAC